MGDEEELGELGKKVGSKVGGKVGSKVGGKVGSKAGFFVGVFVGRGDGLRVGGLTGVAASHEAHKKLAMTKENKRILFYVANNRVVKAARIRETGLLLRRSKHIPSVK